MRRKSNYMVNTVTYILHMIFIVEVIVVYRTFSVFGTSECKHVIFDKSLLAATCVQVPGCLVRYIMHQSMLGPRGGRAGEGGGIRQI